ncbi:MAG: hypothetical protein ACRDQA_24605, partial [Nocardioidaceae bacterium]
KETTKILAKAFPEIDSDTLQTALQTTIFPQIPEGGRMTGVMWRATTKLLLESGSLSKPVSTKEGGIWTNKFIRTSQGTS